MNSTHGLEIGAILESSWGYDQTNVVDQPAYLTSRVEPIESDYDGEPIRRKVHTHGSSPFIAIESYANAYLWDGRPQTATHYA